MEVVGIEVDLVGLTVDLAFGILAAIDGPFMTSMRTLAMSRPSLVLSLMNRDRDMDWVSVIFLDVDDSTYVLIESRATKLTLIDAVTRVCFQS